MVQRVLKQFKKKQIKQKNEQWQNFSIQINETSFFFFSNFCDSLSKSTNLKVLDLSGCQINTYYAI